MKRTTQLSAIIAAAALSGLFAGASARAAVIPGASVAGVQTRLAGANLPAGVLAAGHAVNLEADGKASCNGKDGCKGKDSCKGKNDCKARGNCKTGDNGCKGKNSCKGKGGCKAEEPTTKPAQV